MINQRIIHRLVSQKDLVVPTLFKPVQFNIIKKLDKGNQLSENEKRYLRGKMKDKFNILQELMDGILISEEKSYDELSTLLNSINSYYITGLEALKHNGFGWFFETKIIEVINTKIEGKIALKNKTIKIIRVKSISRSKIIVDKKTGLKYASNEQILKDISFTKNNYAKELWVQMLKRYKKMFVKNVSRFKDLIDDIEEKIDYSKYGV